MTMFLKIYQSTEVIVIFPIRRCILEKCPEILLKQWLVSKQSIMFHEMAV